MIKLTRRLDRPLTAAERTRALRLCLSYDERVKSRLATMSVDGTAVAILLGDHKRGSALRDGTVLAGEGDAEPSSRATRDARGDGEPPALAIVEAAPQTLARVRANSPRALLRAVYHLANRHVPAQISDDEVLIERDPVLEAMLRGLDTQVELVEAPFDPEPGAYEGHAHGDRRGHGHRAEADEVSATLGEQLSIEAHRARRE